MYISTSFILIQFESGQHSGGHKTVSKEMGRPPGTNGYKPPTEAGFPVSTSGMAG
jgi:hypothetical protein